MCAACDWLFITFLGLNRNATPPHLPLFLNFQEEEFSNPFEQYLWYWVGEVLKNLE